MGRVHGRQHDLFLSRGQKARGSPPEGLRRRHVRSQDRRDPRAAGHQGRQGPDHRLPQGRRCRQGKLRHGEQALHDPHRHDHRSPGRPAQADPSRNRRQPGPDGIPQRPFQVLLLYRTGKRFAGVIFEEESVWY